MTEILQRIRDTATSVRGLLKGDTTALMVYGSVARGTDSRNSDFDLLQLSSEPCRPYQIGNVNVSVYTPEFLIRMAKQGSLFVLHLRKDGILIDDPLGHLGKCLAAYQRPNDYSNLRSELRIAANLLSVTRDEYYDNWIALGRISVFILRTTLYAEASQDFLPTFSISEIARRKNDLRIAKAYESKYLSLANWDLFQLKRTLIEEYLGCQIERLGTPEQILLKHQENELLVSLVYRLIGKSKPFDFYVAVRQHMAALRADKPSKLDTMMLRDMML